jgi:hypothetical protein
MHVGEDCRDRARIPARRLGLPRTRIEILKDQLIDAIVDGEGFE